MAILTAPGPANEPFTRGDRYYPAPSLDLPHAPLTPTEWRVGLLLCEGLLNQELGERLGMSRASVKSHLQASYAKLGLHGKGARAALAVWVERRSVRMGEGDDGGGSARVVTSSGFFIFNDGSRH